MNLELAGNPELSTVMLAGLKSAGVSVIYQDNDLSIKYSANLPVMWPSQQEVAGKTDDALFEERNAVKVMSAKRDVILTGKPCKIEVLREADQERHWYLLHIDPDFGTDGRVIGLFTTVQDIDETKYRETVLKTLLRELSHRSKNLLAIIQSVASQTARSSDNLEDFLHAFRNRVQSMSKSQDLVTASDWRGAELFTLAQSQLQPLVGDNCDDFNMTGIDAFLFPNAALHIGLALHELAVDSLAHGALGPAGGQVVLSASKERGAEDREELVVTWTENFVEQPDNWHPRAAEKTGFARTVLSRIVPQALSASVNYKSEKDTLTYQLRIPDSEFEASKSG